MTTEALDAAAPAEAPSSEPHAVRKDVIVVVVILLGAVAVNVLLWAIGGGKWFDTAGLATIGWVGALVSLVGVIVAVLIFRRQKRAAEEAKERQTQLLDQIRATLGEVHTKVSKLQSANASLSDDEDTQDGEDDQWADAIPDGEPDAVYYSSPTGRKRRVFEPSQVPLAVIAALVSVWKSKEKTGKWTVGMLRGALRREGKGNHPWFLIFEPHPGEAKVWRVSRGPGGTDHAVEIQIPRELK